ncbi:Xylose isomerase-like, TIM barrel domain [Moorella glycerini]|uniref:D-tagatose 3-epimerase n=1 Tax=Neomoorella stamsii TaxID=1266720 RepID=A0A9X7J5V2_9FIRM|nr:MULTISPECIES: sugar phosphate isomerase/epimerase family protein [Moorella]PRR76255.1 D-tagatose 3-epimerase [Moorella stamsii]CEP66565.1 Xylose isomerase-like, TIM barrel domain [Moorella glycerini]
MKYSFNTWVYSSFPTWLPAYPIEEVIRRLARMGYQGIEIGAAAPHAYPRYLDSERRKLISKVLKDSNMEVSAMLPAPGGGQGVNVASPYPEERNDAIAYYIDVVRLCAEWGGKIVIWVGGWQIFGTRRKDAFSWSAESLYKVAKAASEEEITIVVEPTPADSNLIETADDALELMEEVSLPNVKVMFDTYHVLYRNEVISDYVYRMDKNLAHIHVSDTDRLPPGSGRADFKPFLQALRDIEYDGWLSFEIGFDRRNDPDSVARKAIEYMKGLEGSY